MYVIYAANKNTPPVPHNAHTKLINTYINNDNNK